MRKNLFLTLGIFFFLSSLLIFTNTLKIYAAAICTWTGNADSNIINTNNWVSGGGCPGGAADHVDLIFPSGPTNKTLGNPASGLIVQSMDFDGDYNMAGADIHIVNGITSTTNLLTVANNITLDADQTFESGTYSGNIDLNGHTLTLDASSAPITMSGNITGTGNLVLLSPNNYTLNLMGNNTFTGSVDYTGNGLSISSSTALGNSANVLTVETGSFAVWLYGNIVIPNDIILGNDTNIVNASGDNQLTGDISAGTSDFVIGVSDGTSLLVSGAMSGSGTFISSGNGTKTFTGDHSAFTGIVTLQYGRTIFNTTHASDISINGGILGGSGTLGTVTAYDGVISPGNSPGILTTGDLFLTSSDTLDFELNGTTAGSGYDQIQSTGNVNLADATLSLSLGFSPVVGDEFTLIQAVGTIAGTFNGLVNGASINIGGANFIISYTAHTVVLTRADILDLPVFTITPTTSTFGTSLLVNFEWVSTGPAITGDVTLMDGATLLGTATHVNGVGTFTISNLAVGTHSITIRYSGDENFGAAESQPIVVTVNPGLAATGVNVPVVSIVVTMFLSLVSIQVLYLKLKNKYGQ